jgi:hypothetical protein
MPQTIENTTIIREASELGLAPGNWPLTLWYDDKEWNRDRFIQTPRSIVSVVYILDDLEPELHVLND